MIVQGVIQDQMFPMKSLATVMGPDLMAALKKTMAAIGLRSMTKTGVHGFTTKNSHTREAAAAPMVTIRARTRFAVTTATRTICKFTLKNS